MAYLKTYIFNLFYRQYLVLFTLAPRNISTWYLVVVSVLAARTPIKGTFFNFENDLCCLFAGVTNRSFAPRRGRGGGITITGGHSK